MSKRVQFASDVKDSTPRRGVYVAHKAKTTQCDDQRPCAPTFACVEGKCVVPTELLKVRLSCSNDKEGDPITTDAFDASLTKAQLRTIVGLLRGDVVKIPVPPNQGPKLPMCYLVQGLYRWTRIKATDPVTRDTISNTGLQHIRDAYKTYLELKGLSNLDDRERLELQIVSGAIRNAQNAQGAYLDLVDQEPLPEDGTGIIQLPEGYLIREESFRTALQFDSARHPVTRQPFDATWLSRTKFSDGQSVQSFISTLKSQKDAQAKTINETIKELTTGTEKAIASAVQTTDSETRAQLSEEVKGEGSLVKRIGDYIRSYDQLGGRSLVAGALFMLLAPVKSLTSWFLRKVLEPVLFWVMNSLVEMILLIPGLTMGTVRVLKKHVIDPCRKNLKKCLLATVLICLVGNVLATQVPELQPILYSLNYVCRQGFIDLPRDTATAIGTWARDLVDKTFARVPASSRPSTTDRGILTRILSWFGLGHQRSNAAQDFINAWIARPYNPAAENLSPRQINWLTDKFSEALRRYPCAKIPTQFLFDLMTGQSHSHASHVSQWMQADRNPFMDLLARDDVAQMCR
jgi:hypothetical protein